MVTVNGAGSSWTNSGTLTVGEFGGVGSLTITNGGSVVSTGDNYVGNGAGAFGKITVDGAGSSFSAGTLDFGGNGGTGALSITNGGFVNASVVDLMNGTIQVDGTLDAPSIDIFATLDGTASIVTGNWTTA